MIARWGILIAVFFTAASCGGRVETEVKVSSWGEVVEGCPQGTEASLSGSEREMLLKWWPDGLFAQDPELESIGVRGSLVLCQTGFEPLRPGSDADTVVRLTQTDWSFQPPMVISMEEAGSRRRVRLAGLRSSQGGTPLQAFPTKEDPKAIGYPSRLIPDEVWSSLVAALSQARLDQVPTWVNERGADGNHYIFELAHGATYEVVVRWSPAEGPLLTLGAHIMRWRLPDTLLAAPGGGDERIVDTAPRHVR